MDELKPEHSMQNIAKAVATRMGIELIKLGKVERILDKRFFYNAEIIQVNPTILDINNASKSGYLFNERVLAAGLGEPRSLQYFGAIVRANWKPVGTIYARNDWKFVSVSYGYPKEDMGFLVYMDQAKTLKLRKLEGIDKGIITSALRSKSDPPKDFPKSQLCSGAARFREKDICRLEDTIVSLLEI